MGANVLKLVYIRSERLESAFDTIGHKMTPKRHAIAFIFSFKIFLIHFLYFFFGEIACLPKSLSLDVMILIVKPLFLVPIFNLYAVNILMTINIFFSNLN